MPSSFASNIPFFSLSSIFVSCFPIPFFVLLILLLGFLLYFLLSFSGYCLFSVTPCFTSVRQSDFRSTSQHFQSSSAYCVCHCGDPHHDSFPCNIFNTRHLSAEPDRVPWRHCMRNTSDCCGPCWHVASVSVDTCCCRLFWNHSCLL